MPRIKYSRAQCLSNECINDEVSTVSKLTVDHKFFIGTKFCEIREVISKCEIFSSQKICKYVVNVLAVLFAGIYGAATCHNGEL